MYTIHVDTREQKGWTFEPSEKCLGMEIVTLQTGDYTMKGFEDFICIERKASPAEIANNLGREKRRFINEMDRMRRIPNKYIICEFSCDQLLRFPEGSGLPKSRLNMVKMTGKIILKSLLEIQMEYGIQVLFCDNPTNAFTVANSIIKRVYEKYGN